MKLLIISPTHGYYGGLEAFAIAVGTAAMAWPELEVQICFKVAGDLRLKEDLKMAARSVGCPVHFVRSGFSKIFSLIRWAEIVHGQNPSPGIIFAAKLFGKKLVLTIQNCRYRTLGAHDDLLGIGLRFARRRWYNSRFVWDTWEPGRKLPGSECVPAVSHLPEAWCAPAERKGFLFMGRWAEYQGLEELIAAYARLQPDSAQWPLILLGDGPLKPRILSLIDRLHVRGVEVPALLDNETPARRLASARWLVAPGRTREDLGHTPIEARSVGVPVIVSRDGGLPEAGGDAALVVEPGDVPQLADALKTATAMSEQEYIERGERGQKTLKEYLRPMEFYRESYAAVGQGGTR